jgi:hypothetical protein
MGRLPAAALQDNGVLRLTPDDLQAHLLPLLERLFAGFSLPESAENEYLMRAVTRVIGWVQSTHGTRGSPSKPRQKRS